MIYRDNDYDHFIKNYPGYIEIFEQYDRKLQDVADVELSVRIRDSTYNDSIVLSMGSFSNELNERKKSLAYNIVTELEKRINDTCSKCGRSPAKREEGDFRRYEVNQLVLCDECWHHIDQEQDILVISSYLYFSNSYKVNDYRKIKLRYINPFDEFDYAKFGSYFFIKDELFIITHKLGYKRYDVKKSLKNTIYYRMTPNNSFVIKGIYSGQDTGFRDDNDERIYTGDILITEGFYNSQRDPYNYFKKDRNIPKDDIISLYKVCGVVSTGSNPQSFMHIAEGKLKDKIYEVVLDNHGAFLSHSTKIKVIGNIFYNLERGENIDIWEAACALAQSDYSKDGFWRVFSLDTVEKELKKNKTPSFKSKKIKVEKSKDEIKNMSFINRIYKKLINR